MDYQEGKQQTYEGGFDMAGELKTALRVTPLPDDSPTPHREGASIGISHELPSAKSRVSQDPIVVEAGVGLKRLFGLIFHGRCQSFGLFWAQRGSQQGSVSHQKHLKGVFLYIFYFLAVMNRLNSAQP